MLKNIISPLLIAFILGFTACKSGQDQNKTDANAPVKISDINNSALEEDLAKDSTNISIRTRLATAYYSAGDLQKAAFHFLKIYEQDNKSLVALINLGNIFYDARQDDKAIQFYEKALEIDPGNIDVKCDLATCYSNINKLKKAIEILRDNIKLNPNHAKSHHNLAVILKKSGNIKESEEEVKIYESLKGKSK